MRVLLLLSSYALPFAVCLFSLVLLFSRKTGFDEFLNGAQDGIKTTVSLLPTLCVLMVAVSMFSASGLPEILASFFAPLCRALGLPSALLPLVFLRPFSGSGSNALLASLFENYGPDSAVGFAASVLLGSSDTLFYILAVYFGSVGVKKTRYAFPAAFLVMVFCLILSLAVCRLTGVL